MRVTARIVGAVILLLMLMVLAIALVLPRIVDTASVRERFADITSSTLGRRLEFQELGFRFFPPSLVMNNATLGAGDEPSGQAERIELTIALSPLLVGIVMIDAAVVEGAHLRLVRTTGGVRLDGAPPSRLHPAAQTNIALRRLALRSATITLDDRSVGPAVRWQLRDVEATAVVEALDLGVRLEFAGEVATGGQVVASGNVGLGGELDFELEFESLAIAAARPYFESNSKVRGVLTGSIRGRGTSANPELELNATLRDAHLQLGDITLRGALEVDATIDDVWGAPHGKIAIDATRAELAYAEFFTKPPGIAATVVGLITADHDGSPAIEVWKFVMEDLDGHVRVHFGDPIPLAMAAIPAREGSNSTRGDAARASRGRPSRLSERVSGL